MYDDISNGKAKYSNYIFDSKWSDYSAKMQYILKADAEYENGGKAPSTWIAEGDFDWAIRIAEHYGLDAPKEQA